MNYLRLPAVSVAVVVEREEFPGMFHDFQAMASWLPDGEEAVQQIGEFLRKRALASRARPSLFEASRSTP